MPKAFENCVKHGGKLRTKKIGKDKYMPICIPAGGGPSTAGHVHTRMHKQKKHEETGGR